jgi:hypothetical protein
MEPDINEPQGGFRMTAIALSVEKHHKLIIAVLVGVILLFLFACTFNDVLPICHWLFKCDHMVMH